MSGIVEHTSGIGDAIDLSLQNIYHYTENDLIIQPAGIIGDPPIDVEDLIRSDIDTWIPALTHGFAYDSDIELYLYANKATEIWTLPNIVNSSGYLEASDPNWLVTSSGYIAYGTTNRQFNSSGYFGVFLAEEPQEESPLIVYKLPYNLEGEMVDDSLSASGYLSTCTGSGIIGSGYYYESSNYTRTGEYEKYTITKDIDNDNLIPLYSKQTPYSQTGFMELNGSGWIGGSGYSYSNKLGGYVQMLPVICLQEQEQLDAECDIAQFIPSTNQLIVPGELCNFMIEYEISDTKQLDISDLDVNPITTINEDNILCIVNEQDATEFELNTSVSNRILIGDGSNSTYLHHSIIDNHGIPGSGIPVYMKIDTDYNYYSNNEETTITPTLNQEELQGGRVYTKLIVPEPLTDNGEYIFDQNRMAIFHSGTNSSGNYLVQSHGNFLCSGYCNIDGDLHSLITSDTTSILHGSGAIVTLPSGYHVSSSGVVMTDNYGSATSRYFAPVNERKNFSASIISSIDDVIKTEIQLDIEPENYMAITFCGSGYLPAIDNTYEYYLGSGIPSGYYSGSGFLIDKEPFGGPGTCKFYPADEYVAYYGQGDTNEPALLGSGYSLSRDTDNLYVQTDFNPSGNIILVYEALVEETFTMNQFREIT